MKKLILSLSVFVAHTLASAAPLTLGSAQELSRELLEWRRAERFMGRIDAKNPRQADLVRSLEGLLKQRFPEQNLKVESALIEATRASVVVAPDAGKARVRITSVQDQRFRESTRLIVEDRTLLRNERGEFAVFSQRHGVSSIEERADMGRDIGNFTLGIFARKVQTSGHEASGVGIALAMKTRLGHGWDLTVRAELSKMEDSKVSLSEGSLAPDAHGELFLRAEVRKSFENGISAGGGLRVRYQGDAGLHQDAVKEIFVSVGYDLKDRQGRDRGRVEVMGVHEVGARSGKDASAIFIGFTRRF